MALSHEKIAEVEQVLRNSLRQKFQNHNPEPAVMPFHTRLLGVDRLAMFSFIHSMNTNFGASIFEPVALALARRKFKSAHAQASPGDTISTGAQRVIQEIMDKLSTSEITPCKPQEIEMIRAACREGEIRKVKATKVDVMLHSYDGEIFMFDLKTAKPNAGMFKEFKRTLLEWVAIVLCSHPDFKVHSCVAIPYNPYDPHPYTRWTMRGMLDLDHELKVAAEFWDFLGEEGSYHDLLGCFERVGQELRPEIDSYFEKFLR